jgi:hypothetical protein
MTGCEKTERVIMIYFASNAMTPCQASRVERYTATSALQPETD